MLITIFKCILIFILNPGVEGKQPNIIFMLTDDMGSADVKFRNPESPFITDNIDAIAADSVRLFNYYVHPTCSPTRAALMTGRYAANVGVSLALMRGNPGGLHPKYPTMAEHLESEGYETYLVGKWHLGSSMLKYHPRNRGFKHFYGLLGGGFNHYTKQCGSGRYDFWRDFNVEYENVTYSTDLFNTEALSVVQKHVEDKSSSPFFLYLSHPAPHDPLQAPARLQEKCKHIENDRRMMSCAMVAGVDEGFGKIIDLLRESGELDNTIIAFSTDNGGVPYAGALNYPLKGGKSTMWEGGVRAPGFIYAPKQLGEGYDFQGLFHVTDFFPTFLAMINSTKKVEKGVELDGINQLQSLVKKEKNGVRESVHIHRDIDRDSHAFRKGPWKIIVGHHYLPLIFDRVYNETTTGWLVENGNWRDKLRDIIIKAMDFITPTQNTIFIQYILWVFIDSPNVGGLSSIRNTRSDTNLMEKPYKTDLDYWRNQHSIEYPTIGLYNLEEDPQELNNLAFQHPDLVKSLLAEAEEQVKNAPTTFRGDILHKTAPIGPQAGLIAKLRNYGSHHSKVIPFGAYLPDDFDLERADENDFIRLLNQQMPEILFMFVQLFSYYVVVPLFAFRFIYNSLLK
ncbi:arylsulfatase B [Eurytemora carolleeae]|uniref:arylsulfatase B n=1 Tax=Eurytemora carolleeae TaxID=1294199 RepID=UPI000C780DB2|nr:arylsulfatase B [Eurytemora carolleeae]|eukprot:XP_023326945.1 arylsulfatase B-like [Eurytemora affinis]